MRRQILLNPRGYLVCTVAVTELRSAIMFYYLSLAEAQNVRAAVETIRRAYQGRVLAGDNMIAICKNLTFNWDPRFVNSFRSTAHTTQEQSLIWRLHVLTWAAKQALHIQGDFVECGVYRGFSSAVVCKYLDFATLSRSFYLYDNFGELPAETSTEAERAYSRPPSAKDPVEWITFVRQTFSPYPNVKVIKGVVPFIFDEIVPEKIAYLHIDLNAAKAEQMALERLFDRVAPGGIIILDDYGWDQYKDQTIVALEFMRKRGLAVLELPTGQGMVIKPPAVN